MKKSLFALAALGAFAGVAQAQSSVTLYGNIDSSVVYINNAGQANGAAASLKPSSTFDTANAWAYVDSAISSSLWGLKGVEDLGGGLKAKFNLEGDANTNAGTPQGSSTSGLTFMFRRSANVSIEGGFGEIALGTQGNPLAQVSATMLPVMGNTVHNIRSQSNGIGYAAADYLNNAISYQSPILGGFKFKAGYGMSNTTGDNTGGTILGLNAMFNSGNLDLGAGYNKQWARNNITGNDSCTVGTVGFAPTSNDLANVGKCMSNSSPSLIQGTKFPGDLTGYVVGAKYRIMPTLQLGYAYANSDYSNGNSSSTITKYNAAAHMFGLGFNATPTLLLGANYITSTQDASMYNLQARYSLSKRTTIYAQGTMVKNGAGTLQSSDTAFGNMQATATNTNGMPSNVGGFAVLPNTTQTALGVGVIHSF